MKKFLYAVFVVLSIQAVRADQIELTVDNQIYKQGHPQTIKNMQVRLVNGNSWLSLGTVSAGRNVFEINAPKSSIPGIAKIQMESGKTYVMTFHKEKTMDKISIFLSAPEGQNGPSDQLNAVVNNNFQPIPILPMAENQLKSYLWASECGGGAVVAGTFGCLIHSAPEMAYVDTKGTAGGGGFGITELAFGSDQLPEQLIGQYAEADVIGFLYIQIHFEPAIAWANGAGVFAGFFIVSKSSGQFQKRTSL